MHGDLLDKLPEAWNAKSFNDPKFKSDVSRLCVAVDDA
jgi:hypothetical protein